MKIGAMAIAIGSVMLSAAGTPDSRVWPLDGTFAEANGGCPFAPDRETAPSFVQEDGHTALRLKGDMLTANGEAVFDLLPGLAIRARVKFTDRTIIDLRGPIFGKGLPSQAGAYFLRVDPQPEKLRFSFFVNDGDVEPRVSSRVPIRPGEWYDLAAGWDGTNIWLTVNGEMARRARPVRPVHLAAPFSIGSFNGLLRDVGVVGGRQPAAAMNDVHVEPGLQIGCRVVFDAEPTGETTLVQRPGEYLLRYDVVKGIGRFNFYVMLDGKWEPHAACRAPIELGRPYNVLAEWDGMRSHLQVDGRADNSILRCGKPHPGNRPLGFPPFKGRLENVSVRVVKSLSVRLADLHTEEFQPREGEAARLCGLLRNYGNLAISNCVVTASASGNVALSPATQTVAVVAGGAEAPLAWQIAASTNEVVSIALTVLADGHRLARAVKDVPFMPERVPAHLSRTWQPPIRATRAFHIDAADGDDARDGLTPATAWRSFANISGRTLGPGERLLLKRGSVFNEELQVTARGRPDNWAEIGAYGAGPRPTIRRNRFINDRCAYVRRPSYLAVRDIVFCNAGKGLDISCGGGDCRGILVERCLAHHIEGLYRPNAHGIPEWRDCLGAPGSGNTGGIGIMGGRDVVLRDCEMYQCSSGFRATGRDVVLQRLFCHDNYSHNTSPHPFFTSTVRAWLLDSVFDASGWKASAGTMGIMLGGNEGLVIRNCHFLNQPHSGSGDEGGIDFEFKGENCQIDRCTFRNNAGAAIEVLGLRSPQARNTLISRCRFDRNNYAHKLGPSEIFVWGGTADPEIVCSSGRIEDNGYVLAPGVMFYTNKATRTWRDWKLAGNRAFDSAEALDRAFPYNNPPAVDAGAEIWSDNPRVELSAAVSDDGKPGALALAWEQLEGPGTVAFEAPNAAQTTVTCPGPGDYRLLLKADDGEHWRTGRTAVHILPPGLTMARAWTFARNLDTEGWTHGDLGTAREEFPSAIRVNSTFADPVHLVCGDYYVLAVKNAASAHILSPDDLGVSSEQADTLVIRLQNHTDSTRMRVSFTTAAAPEWARAQTCSFDVTPKDEADTVYRVPLHWKGALKQLRIDFAASGRPVTGTCRIDYIGLSREAQTRHPVDCAASRASLCRSAF